MFANDAEILKKYPNIASHSEVSQRGSDCGHQGVGTALPEKKKRIRIGFIKNLAPDIQSVLKVNGTKC
jgi:hypothetical protein